MDIELFGVWQSRMVVQRDCQLTVRGRASANSVVAVKIGTVGLEVATDDEGFFSARLPKLAAAENLTMVVCDVRTQAQKTLTDVAVGDVYLVAGQSNVEFPLKNCRPGVDDFTAAELAGIRYFKVPVRSRYGGQTQVAGHWQAATQANIGGFSGVGMFFARKLREKNRVPVGLIEASLGGMNVEAWISRDSLYRNPAYRDELIAYEKKMASQPRRNGSGDGTDYDALVQSGLMALFPTVPDDGGEKKGFAKPDYPDETWDEMRLPDSWTQAGHNHAGIFWFRRAVTLPDHAAQTDWQLHLGAIDKADQVWINGHRVGATGDARKFDHWNALRVYRVPGRFLRSGNNTIAVRAASLASICTDGGLLGPAEEMYMTPVERAEPKIGLAGLWRYRETLDAGTVGMSFMRTLGEGAPGSLHMLYDNMIAPLRGTTLRGVLWYQGEANAICTASRYQRLLEDMIRDWRVNFDDEKLDFFIVQLPEFHNPHLFAPFSSWALLREAQLAAADNSESSCLVTLGSGSVTDLHPRDKKTVGEAAARAAAARLDGKKAAGGPRWRKMSRVGNRLLLQFDPATPLAAAKGFRGFVVVGPDGEAYPAYAALADKNTLEVWAPKVSRPQMLYYAWADHPSPADLRGADGLAASPFRARLQTTDATDAGRLRVVDGDGTLPELPAVWADTAKLFEVAPVEAATVPFALPPEVRAISLRSVPYKGKPTEVFALVGLPEGAAGKAGRLPGIVLVHGGGGTAFLDWVRHWNRRGYAAIAVDIMGGRPLRSFEGENARARNERYRGPEEYFAAETSDADGWPFHAAAAVIKAHSYLLGLPEVDRARTVLSGISWGTVIGGIVAGVDTRFQAAGLVYGCGFLNDATFVRAQYLEKIGAARAAAWLERWDPSRYLARATLPILFGHDPGDRAFWPYSWQRSSALPPGWVQRSIRPNLGHSHRFGMTMEVEEFMDFHTRMADKALPILTEWGLDGGRVTVAWANLPGDTVLQLIFSDGDWKKPNQAWHSRTLKTAYQGERLEFSLPPEARCFFVNAVTVYGLNYSSPYQHVGDEP